MFDSRLKHLATPHLPAKQYLPKEDFCIVFVLREKYECLQIIIVNCI